MDYSQRLVNKAEMPLYRVEEGKGEGGFSFTFQLSNSEDKIIVYCSLDEASDTPRFHSLSYSTSITGTALGFIDSVFELLQKRKINDLTALTVREVESFLRDSNQTPSIPKNGIEMYPYFEVVKFLHKELLNQISPVRSSDERESPSIANDYMPIQDTVKKSFNAYSELMVKDQYIMLNQIIDKMIRPFLQRDGGDIELCFIDGNMAVINFLGACSQCLKNLTSTMDYITDVLRFETGDNSFQVITDS